MAITVSTTVASAYETVKPFEPPWASWAEHLPPQIQQYITRNSEVVDWLNSPEGGPTWPLSNWVKAAAYIVYYAPMKHVTPTPQRVVQAAEGSSLILPHKPNGIPDWGRVRWGPISESRFAQAVEHDPLNHGGVQVTNVFKAAVRIAYWVASFINGSNFGTPIKLSDGRVAVAGDPYQGIVTFKEFTPLEVLEHPYGTVINGHFYRGWNCAAHAVLAAALMRAMMIPVMVVWGEAFYRGNYVGDHAWVAFYNESGRWVNVDPTGDPYAHRYAELEFTRVMLVPDSRNLNEYYKLVDVEYLTHRYQGYALNNNAASVYQIRYAWKSNIYYEYPAIYLPLILAALSLVLPIRKAAGQVGARQR